MNDLMRGILGEGGNDIDLAVFDGEHPAPAALMYETDNNPLLLKAYPSLYQTMQRIEIPGHAWTIKLRSLPAFEFKLNTLQTTDIRIAGSLVSTLLSLLIWQLISLRKRALDLAYKMTGELRSSENRAITALAELQHQKFALDQHAIVARTDIRGTITYANEKFYQISGYAQHELLGKNHRILNSGTHPKGFFTAMFHKIASGKVWRGEICNRAKDGHLYWVLTTIVPFMGDNGKPFEYIAIRSDITKRKLAEQQIAEVKQELENVLDAASEMAIVATDAKGLIRIFNTGAEKMFGYSADEMIGKQTPQILHIAEEIEMRAAELSAELGFPVSGFDVFTKKAQMLGQDTHIWTYVRKDGFLLKTSLMVTLIRNPQGEIDGYLGIVRDITNEFLAQQALQKSEAKLRSLFEMSPLGIALTDIQGKYIEFNEAFRQLTGYAEDELKELDYWTLTPKKYYAQEQLQLRNLLQTGRYGPFEKEYRHKDGHPVSLRLNGVLIKDIENNDFIWSIIEDISISKQIEDNLRQAKAAADNANRVKSEFVATVSHELRTPLTSILGCIELILGGATGGIPEPSSKLLVIAGSNCKRLMRLINDMLDLEKLESDSRIIDIKPIDIIPLVAQTIEGNQAYADKLGITLAVSHEQAEVIVLADSDCFNQALTNLLSNAIKFSYPGGRVDIDIETIGQRCRLGVTDYGAGIKDSFKSRIFEKFTQEDATNTRQKGGTGLGLSITKALIEKMGGVIDYESEPDKKTTFFFELPLYRPE